MRVLLFLFLINITSKSFTQEFDNVNIFKKYLDSSKTNLDYIEGIWRISCFNKSFERSNNGTYKLLYNMGTEEKYAVYKVGQTYYAYLINFGEEIEKNQIECTNYVFQKTAKKNVYIVEYNCSKNYYSEIIKPDSEGNLFLTIKKGDANGYFKDEITLNCIKLYPYD